MTSTVWFVIILVVGLGGLLVSILYYGWRGTKPEDVEEANKAAEHHANGGK